MRVARGTKLGVAALPVRVVLDRVVGPIVDGGAKTSAAARPHGHGVLFAAPLGASRPLP
jgi:hypothetical protein